MKTLNEVCNITGLSRRMIQEFEKFGLSETPKHKNKYGHLLYSNEEVDRLWQLRFYKELGYSKSKMKEILHDPNYDKKYALKMQIKQLENKRDKIDSMINVANNMVVLGIFSYTRNIIPDYLLKDNFDDSLNLFNLFSKFDFQDNDFNIDASYESNLIEEINSVFDIISLIMSLSFSHFTPGSKKVQGLLEDLFNIFKKYLSSSIFTYDIFFRILINADLQEEIDDCFGKGKSAFLFEAHSLFVKNHIHNEYDMIWMKSFDLICKYYKEGYNYNSNEVQKEIPNLLKSVNDTKLFTEKGKLKITIYLASIFKEFRKLDSYIDEKTIKIYMFLSNSIEYFIGKINDDEQVMRKEEAYKFVEYMNSYGDEWTEEMVLDVYGKWTLEKAINDRLSCLEMHKKNIEIAKNSKDKVI